MWLRRSSVGLGLAPGVLWFAICYMVCKQTALCAEGGRGRPPLLYGIFIIINHMGVCKVEVLALRNAEDSVPYRTWFNHITLYK